MAKIYLFNRLVIIMATAFVIVFSIFHTDVQANPNQTQFSGFLTYHNLVLAPGSSESQRRFAWYTEQPSGWLTYRIQGSQSYTVLKAESSASATRSGQFVHRVTINGLLPSNTYEYMLVGPGGLQSRLYIFRTSNFSDFSFFVMGDIQIGAGGDVVADANAWINTLSVAANNFPNAEMILSVGDQVHQGGSVAAFNGLFSPGQLSRLPFAPTVGNHDSGTRFFLEHHNIPNVTPFGTGATQINYWFRYGSALFIVLDSNTTNISVHREFLETTVNNNRDATWRIVMFHHGPYTEFRAQHYAPKVAIRHYWIPVLDSLGIDVVLNGHCHAYSRTFQMWGNQPQKNQHWIEGGSFRQDPTGLLYNTVFQPTGTVYFTLNSSTGNRFYQLAGRQPRFFTASRSQENLPNFSVVNVTDHSFSIVTYQVNPDNTITRVDSYTIISSLS